jgi:site-specific recombinase XerD
MPRAPTYRRKAEEWITSLEAENAPAKTISAYKFAVLKAWKYGMEHQWPEDPRKLEPKHIRAYQEFLKQYATTTQASYLIPLLVFLRWDGNRSLDNFKTRLRPVRSKVDWLTEEEVGRAFATAPLATTKAMEIVFAYTGIRLSELRELKLSEMTPSHLIVLGKGSKGRRIPLTMQFWDAIRPYMTWRSQRPGNYFLIHDNARGHKMGPYSEGGMKEAIAAHIPILKRHVSAHTFRRSYGRHLYKRGMPLVEIQGLYGHASLQTTINYLGITDEDRAVNLQKYQPTY